MLQISRSLVSHAHLRAAVIHDYEISGEVSLRVARAQIQRYGMRELDLCEELRQCKEMLRGARKKRDVGRQRGRRLEQAVDRMAVSIATLKTIYRTSSKITLPKAQSSKHGYERALNSRLGRAQWRPRGQW